MKKQVKYMSKQELLDCLRLTQQTLSALDFAFDLPSSELVYFNPSRTGEPLEQYIEKRTISITQEDDGMYVAMILPSSRQNAIEEYDLKDLAAILRNIVESAEDALKQICDAKPDSKWLKFEQSDFCWGANGKPFLRTRYIPQPRLEQRDGANIFFNSGKKIDDEFCVILAEEFNDKINSVGSLCELKGRRPIPVTESIATEAFEQHDTLNPKLWNGEKLKPQVKEHLRKIIKQYVEDSQFLKEEYIIAANIVGSNASFNYTDKSDLDLHLVVDMSSFSNDPRFVQLAADGEKTLFNKRYDLTFAGIGVEVYVEDVTASAISNGIYDVFEDVWIKKPVKYEADIDYEAYAKKYSAVKSEAERVLASDSIPKIQKFINSLYEKRKYSLLQYGEPGDDNQIFKDLRNEGILSQLKDKVNELKSRELSLEDAILEAFDD